MKKWSLFLIVVLLLSLVPVASMGVVRAESTSQRTVTITPTDDRWIDEGGYVDSNTYRLRVGTYRGSEERAYLKFNLSELGIPPEFIISATLNLYAYYHYGSRSKSHNITVYGVADSWNENSINWSNKPQNLTNALDWQLIGSVRKWYSWNVTDFVKSELNGDKVVSFMLHSNLSHESTKDYIYFSSKETSYTDEKPYLEIVYRTPISISSINVPKSAVRNQPFKINVILQNSKTLDENVTFLIYVDGQLFKNETILLKASSSKELSYEYTPQTLGTHQIKAEIVGYGTKYASVEVYENPSTIINTFSRYYAIRYIRQEPRVNELYEEFTNLTEQLKGYGVDLAPLSGDIER
ncbi:DNRLRE domain-containing protein, partial [Palaeococcus sp. (in: euryarchaeotes)]